MTNASELFSKDGIIGYREFRASTTWSPPFRMRAIVHCIGGGGSGGSNTISNTGCVAVSGGGAGEHSASILILDPAVTYTVTAGAGGAAGTDITTSGGTNAGNAGGASSFSGTGITTITANGGSGGAQDSQPAGTGVSVSGGAGGTGGAGELFTFDGGRGGDAEVTTSGLAKAGAISGGGAVGVDGNGFRGGDAVMDRAQARRVATGGGGTGGRGGDLTMTSGSTNPISYGGSNTMDAGDVPSGSADGDPPLGEVFDSARQGSVEAIFSRGLFEALKLSTFAYPEGTNKVAPPGCGGFGSNSGPSNGGAFSGGGGNSAFGINVTQSEGGYPGGGGGGATIVSFSTDTLTCAPGGDGCVIIELLEILA